MSMKLLGIPVPLPKPCRRLGCKITKADGTLYHYSKQGHVHRGATPEPMVWQRDVQPWAANVHGIMGWA